MLERASRIIKLLPKSTKCNGTRWIDHKYKALDVLYENYSMRTLVQTHSQALKQAEIEGFTKKWKHGSYIIHTAIYLDILRLLQ